jgi:hypothetical protein
MNRRSFLKRMFGVAGAIAAGPVALKVAAELLPKAVAPTVNPAWINAPFEASFIIPVEELLAQTTWYWNELSLKNLMRGVDEHACIKPFYPTQTTPK